MNLVSSFVVHINKLVNKTLNLVIQLGQVKMELGKIHK